MCPLCNANAEMIMPISTVWWIVAASVLVTFIISWLLFHHLWFKRTLYPKFCRRLENLVEFMGYWLQRLWYAILFIGSSTYLFLHFDECRDLTFTSKFNGNNVIFIFWLILVIVPLFDKIKFSGISIETRKQAQEYDASYRAAMKAANKEQILDAKALEELLKNGGHDE